MQRNFQIGLALVLGSLPVLACGNLTVKVQKKPHDVSTSASQSADTDKSENSAVKALENAEDFAKALDGLKGIAIEKIIAELATSDYRKRFRDGFRYYRARLTAKVLSPVADSNSFYDSDEQCRNTKLSLNIDDADEYLGMIMQAGVLATLSKQGSISLNSKKSKEIQAIAELVLRDLGISAKGTTDVIEEGSSKITTGEFELRLLSDVSDSVEDKAKDAAEILKLKLVRKSGNYNAGSLVADLSIGKYVSATVTDTIALHVETKRKKNSDGLWSHSGKVRLGLLGQNPLFSHALKVEEVAGATKSFKINDTLNADQANEHTVVTTYDLDSGDQCKVSKKSKKPVETLPPPPSETNPPAVEPVVTPIVSKPGDSSGKPTQNPGQTSTKQKPVQSPTQN